MVGNWIRRVLGYGMVDLNMSPRFRMVKIQESLQELGQNGSRILIGQNPRVFNDGFRIGLKVTKNSIFTLDSPFESAFLKNFVNFKKIKLKNINISLFRGCLEVCATIYKGFHTSLCCFTQHGVASHSMMLRESLRLSFFTFCSILLSQFWSSRMTLFGLTFEGLLVVDFWTDF